MRTLDFIRLNAPFLAAGFLLSFGSSFGQTFFISLFAGEIRAEFGLTHAAWGSIYGIATLASAGVMLWSGALTDTFRVRSLGAATIIALAFACGLMAITPAAWALIPAIFLLRLTGQGMMSHISAVAMARWFVAARGRALAIGGLGFSTAEAALPIIFVSLLALYDWRLLWGAAAVAALLMLPVLSRLLRMERTPQAVAQDNQSVGMKSAHWRRRDVLKNRLFWFMIPALIGPGTFNTAFFFQQVHFVEVKDWTHLQFVALIPIFTVVAVSSMVFSGVLLDRFGTARMMPLYQLPMVGAFLFFANATTPVHAAIGMAFMGLTNGANATLPSAFWAEFYGTRYLGSIKALGTAIMVLGSAIGPGITGFLITYGIGYETQLGWIAGFFGFVCLSAYVGVWLVRKDLPDAP